MTQPNYAASNVFEITNDPTKYALRDVEAHVRLSNVNKDITWLSDSELLAD